MRTLILVLATALCGACASSGEDSSRFEPVAPHSAWVVGADGRAIGEVKVTETPTGVLIRLEFSENALTPGWHGAHVHQVGDCSDPAAGFQASASHVGHGGDAVHGLANSAGPESGDLPNIFATASGRFGAEFFSDRLTLGPARAGRMALLDEDGSALVVHAGPDDHISQPIGGAGPRVGCAALTAAP